jgi:Ca2+-binding RTX toxin-like protein
MGLFGDSPSGNLNLQTELHMATYDLGGPGNSDFGLSHNHPPDGIGPGNSDFGLSHNHPGFGMQLSAANPDPSVRDFVHNFLFNEDNSASPVSGPQDVPDDTQNAADNMVLTGQDTVFGDAGNNTIPAADANDSILGGGGDEQLLDGEAGNDTIFGGDGDRQSLSGGADTLLGAESADTLFGDAGANDTLSGGDGADQMALGAGTDTISGGGDDPFEINSHMDDSTSVGGGGTNVDSTDAVAGTTTISFTDGQQIQDLVFSDDPTQKLP